MTTSSPPGGPLSIAGVHDRLARLSVAVQRVARRSYRLSWFAWGAAFAVFLGTGVYAVLAFYFATTVTTTTFSGTASMTTNPWWVFLPSFGPGIVLFGLAVRELLLGRREAFAGTGVDEGRPLGVDEELPSGVSWVQAVQESQRALTHAKHETDFSIVALILATLYLGFLAIETVLAPLLGLQIGATVIELGLVGVVPEALLIGVLYRVSRQWIGTFQSRLDHGVRDLGSLEAEFLRRFTGALAPG